MNKKIIVACTTKSVFNEPVIKNLTKLGFEVEFFDLWNNHPLLSNNLVLRLLNLIPKQKPQIQALAQNKINKKLLKLIDQFKPDYFLALKGKIVTVETVKQISSKGIKTINWFPDATTNWNSIKFLSPHYDYFFVFDPYILKLLKAKGQSNCYYLPFAADIEKEAEFKSRKNYKYDITFIGSYEPGLYDDRIEYLSELKDLDLHIWGNQNWKKTRLSQYYHGFIKTEDMFNIYQSSKIVINISQQIEFEEGINLRPYEVTSVGSFLLNDPIKDDIFKLFEDGKEVVVFKDAQDLRKKVLYYLEHEDERERIAYNGFERTKKEHTYFDRFNEMFKIVNS